MGKVTWVGQAPRFQEKTVFEARKGKKAIGQQEIAGVA
jgi:hypothetical protein